MLLFQEELARSYWSSSDSTKQAILDFIAKQDDVQEFMKFCNCITNYPFRG